MRGWERAHVQLAPIIGEGGFRVLFARALHLTSKDHPWLELSPEAGEPFVHLQASMAAQSTQEADKAGHALLATFTGLLHALIGESLTGRLLVSDAGAPSEPRNQEVEP